MQPPQDMVSLVETIQAHKFEIQLSQERLAFLASMALLHNEAYQASFQEEELLELFYALEPLLPSSGEATPARASHWMNELVEQHLLLRLSGDSLEPQATYRLTSLGLAIAEHILNRQAYASLSLSVQLQQLSHNLSSILEAAERGGDFQHWKQHIFAPLKYAVAELFERIDHNQRLLDVQQKSTQLRIAELIHQRWSESLQACEALLSETSEALQELQRALEVVGAQLQSHLTALRQRLQDGAAYRLLSPLMLHLQNKLDRILGWGERTMTLWAAYDRHVHKFLRTTLAIEHSKRLTYLLRQSMVQFLKQPWMLTFCQAERYREIDILPSAALQKMGTGSLDMTPMGSVLSEAQEEDAALQSWLHHWKSQPPGLTGRLRPLLQSCIEHFGFKDQTYLKVVQKVAAFFAENQGSEAEPHAALSPWLPLKPCSFEFQAERAWVAIEFHEASKPQTPERV